MRACIACAVLLGGCAIERPVEERHRAFEAELPAEVEPLRGRPAVVNFFSPDDPEDARNIDVFVDNRHLLDDDCALVGVITGSRTREEAVRYCRSRGIEYLVFFANPATLDAFEIVTTPTTVLLDRDGRLFRPFHPGPVRWEELEREIRPLLDDRVGAWEDSYVLVPPVRVISPPAEEGARYKADPVTSRLLSLDLLPIHRMPFERDLEEAPE